MSNERSSEVSLNIREEQDATPADEVSAPEPFEFVAERENTEEGPESEGTKIEHDVIELLDEIVTEAEDMNRPAQLKIVPVHSVINAARNQDNHTAGSTSKEASNSRSGTQLNSINVADTNLNDEAGPSSNNNNNCRALLPYSSKNQMIPIALLRKTSTGSLEGSSVSGGLMQIITGTNKVAPAVSNPESVTTVGAAVLMLVPKKSDAVCIDMNTEHDQENNCAEASKQCAANICSSDHGVVKPTQSYDSYEEVCRICHDNPTKLELISPCLCKGSMSKVHRTCLERWLGESAKNSCEICGYEYNTVRKPKYTGCSSVFQWIRHPLSPSDTRNLFFDIACFFILTPLAAISSWLCVVGAQHYTFGEERRKKTKYHDATWGRNDHVDASNATWTSVGLLSLTGTLLVAYTVWLFVAIKYHIQAWSDWQQRNFTVTIIPFEDGQMSHPPPPREGSRPPPNNSGSPIQAGSSGGVDGIPNNNNVYNFEPNPNFSHYNPSILMPHSTTRGRGRNFLRHGHHHRTYNLPSVFNRNNFLRNPPPGYTISETTMLYQALYGSDSESFFNENILAFLAESSENVTEEPSTVAVANADGQAGSVSSSRVDDQQQPEQEEESNNNDGLLAI